MVTFVKIKVSNRQVVINPWQLKW